MLKWTFLCTRKAGNAIAPPGGQTGSLILIVGVPENERTRLRSRFPAGFQGSLLLDIRLLRIYFLCAAVEATCY